MAKDIAAQSVSSVIFKEKLIETCLDHCKEGKRELLKNMIS